MALGQHNVGLLDECRRRARMRSGGEDLTEGGVANDVDGEGLGLERELAETAGGSPIESAGPAARTRRLAPLRDKTPGQVRLHEVYRSIQGEGTWAGLPCVFVRLTACHLRCVYCDTPHAFVFREGGDFTIEAIVARVAELAEPGGLVEVTGGEPLLQPEALPLMTALADAGFEVLLETSGSLDIAPVDRRVHIIMDLKTPGSGEEAANLWTNLDHLKPTDNLKFVVTNRADFDWTLEIVRRHDLTARCPVLVSPAFDAVSPRDLAEWILKSRLPLRMQLQLHKLIWHPKARGV
ncbi:Radical SAM domain protein [Isosphaera pallida ATCC 43644]|uniref:7-carboxy-7-deazaguanine synthase n=2 Tax=Isosphaera pallida TaxID=128 RepID=E8R001_ISOPI|nr:Radical SAM domain protein [Isosphaera pallida ATCC 43644]